MMTPARGGKINLKKGKINLAEDLKKGKIKFPKTGRLFNHRTENKNKTENKNREV